jgi:hypothetical protein
MHMPPRRSVAAIVILTLFVGCGKDSPVDPPAGIPDQTNGRITVINDEAKLASRMTIMNTDVSVVPSGSAKASTVFALFQIAEIAPPAVKGQSLQATSVVLANKLAYVSYNMAGSDYIGAIDVIKLRSYINPAITSEATFTDTDVSSVCASDTYVYLATASGNPDYESPSVVEAIGISGNKLDFSRNFRRVLSSYVATSVATYNGRVYVTTGNTGGLYTLSGNGLQIESFVGLDDARWVDTDGKSFAVAQGTPGRITLFDQAAKSGLGTFPFKGAGIAESKSTVRVIGGKALIAAGDGGVQLMSLADGTILGSLPRLVVPNLDPGRSVTNAVDGAQRYVFISNGEAGVYVAESSSVLEDPTGNSPIILKMLGKLQFDKLESANHVAFDGEFLVVAAGLGGVKIVVMIAF